MALALLWMSNAGMQQLATMPKKEYAVQWQSGQKYQSVSGLMFTLDGTSDKSRGEVGFRFA